MRPGLGKNITRALEQVNVGAAFDAGLAIVIMAIVLDRLTTRRASMPRCVIGRVDRIDHSAAALHR